MNRDKRPSAAHGIARNASGKGAPAARAVARSASREWASELDDPTDRQRTFAAALSRLTRRQRLICVWKKAGFSDREIARHLRCSWRSVELIFETASAVLRAALRG